jgi:hypothetical protein
VAVVTFEEFLAGMARQLYVWRMAEGNLNRKMLRSRETRLTRTRRRVDDLVLQRAASIADERRCAAVHPDTQGYGDSLVRRCEYQRGHGPVGPGPYKNLGPTTTVRRDWDHGAPGAGVWWMEKEQLDG